MLIQYYETFDEQINLHPYDISIVSQSILMSNETFRAQKKFCKTSYILYKN